MRDRALDLTALPPLPLYREPSPQDVERWQRQHERATVAQTQRLQPAIHVRAEIAADELRAPLAARAERRASEIRLADYLDRVVRPICPFPWLTTLAAKLRTCRQSGTVALLDSGKTIVMWDAKCGQARLCPDEARNETHRLIETYATAIEVYLKRHSGARLYSGVFTVPNFPDGKLHAGLRDIFRRFNRFRKKREARQLVFPQIAGSLCVVEAPRSARGDWNVHLNVFLLCDSYLSFEQVRKHWHWNVELRQVKGSTDAIVKSLKEGIKYAVRVTPEKSEEHAAAGKSKAPAMIQWPGAAWLEWWNAHRGYRRVRSYGALFLNKKQRELLDLPEVEPHEIGDMGMTILGRVTYAENGYTIKISDLDLIREDKSHTGDSRQSDILPSRPPP